MKPALRRNAIKLSGDDMTGDNLQSGDSLQSSNAADDASPHTPISELMGRPLRAYRTGDMLDQSYLPERVNIECGTGHKIVRIWYG